MILMKHEKSFYYHYQHDNEQPNQDYRPIQVHPSERRRLGEEYRFRGLLCAGERWLGEMWLWL